MSKKVLIILTDKNIADAITDDVIVSLLKLYPLVTDHKLVTTKDKRFKGRIETYIEESKDQVCDPLNFGG